MTELEVTTMISSHWLNETTYPMTIFFFIEHRNL
jgi:hypothetical protein